MADPRLIEKYERYVEAVKRYFQLQEAYEGLNKQYMELCQKEAEIRKKIPGIMWAFLIVPTVLGTIVFPVIGTVIGFVIGLVSGATFVMLFKADKGVQMEADRYHSSVVAPMEIKCIQHQAFINHHIHQSVMRQLFDDVPEDFRTLPALEFCLKMLKNRQADTEKECYNLYMDYLLKQQMVDLQSQQVRLQDQQVSLQTVQVALAQASLNQQIQQTSAIKESNRIAQQQKESIEKGQKKISKQVRYGNMVDTMDFLKKK